MESAQLGTEPATRRWLSVGSSVLAATDEACTAAVTALGGARPAGMLVFDCISRGELLDEAGRREELRRLAEHADGVPFAGFYSWGEIARTRGINGFHHQTLVVLAVA